MTSYSAAAPADRRWGLSSRKHNRVKKGIDSLILFRADIKPHN
jgi:hypothetical protein